MQSHKIRAKSKFLTDHDFIETQIKIEEIYEEKQRRLEMIKVREFLPKINQQFSIEKPRKTLHEVQNGGFREEKRS